MQIRSIFLIALTALTAANAFAQDRAARDQRNIDELKARLQFPAELTDAEIKENARDYLDRLEADYQESKRNESTTVRGVVGSTSVGVRCAEGYVTGRRIQTSAQDVEIAGEQQADCDAVGCRAIQVDAHRPNQDRFSVTVSVSCTG